ncbi:type IV pilus assembly protein PilX [Cupriavidus necator N-1]|uniref:Type IV pilus assembly protein PilX n=1 Tax=Cupriavidus necator (strain ATCC 43291 / DSM 13513 / CCUG 52238 / LMG 8453 / N-1) TaxID=1042878 RepID=G0ET50_CUPNN|nr:PilX N-terminal domain-containing pilus assembly protein [Cupriavidus necator]AEI78056.1 type IV pilus assembly protein PilX [Cupriavidus necator N-1]MDX6013413.1 PilX N-terminal domain-containing pilus assembly protein [Cupriavidus necator]
MNARTARPNPRGIALITALVMLLIISVIAIAGARLAIGSKRMASNQRDRDLAQQAAEAALLDAEIDIQGVAAPTSRSAIFSGTTMNVLPFVAGCNTGVTGASPFQGLCDPVLDGTPNWLTVDFSQTGANARTTAYGTFTGRRFPTATGGLLPAALPRYIIEPINDMSPGASEGAYIFRVTAVGFGANPATRVMLQSYYRKGE